MPEPPPYDGKLDGVSPTHIEPVSDDGCVQVVLLNQVLSILNLTRPQGKKCLKADIFGGYQTRTPRVPDAPVAFTEALSKFCNDPSMEPVEVEVGSLWRWLRRVSESLDLLQAKLSAPWWHSHLAEGFYDSNVWGPIIDNLWLLEPNMLLIRKEIELLRKYDNRKMDGIIRYGSSGEVFDIGVLEVAKALPWGQAQTKATLDLTKVTQVMGIILHDLLARRKLTEDQRRHVQVVGFICGGWSCCALRMWADGDKYVMKERSFGLALGRDLQKNAEFLRTLVRYRAISQLTGHTVAYHAESDSE